MPTKEIGPTKIERYSASDQETVSIAADAKTPSYESSSRAAARLEAASRDCVKQQHPGAPKKL
jgi:hypothetical protein